MRPLFLILASLFSFSTAQGVTQLEPTTADLARLLGDVTSLEVVIPEGAKSVRIAYVMGDEGGHSEGNTPLWLSGEPTGGEVIRLLLLAPGLGYPFECSGEPIDVFVTFPGGLGGGGGNMCTPLLEGAGDYISRSKHEYVLTGHAPVLEEWTPVYLRAFTFMERNAPTSSHGFDLTRAFTIQILFSAADYAPTQGNPPLLSEGLMQFAEIRRRVDPFAR